MYLEYSDYLMMGGSAEAPAFSRLEFRAEKIINRFTQKRVKAMAEVPEAVKRCMVELIEAMNTADPTQTAVKPAVSGFSNDGYSESYANPVTTESLETAYYGIIRDYLATETDDNGTPLLYLGVDA